ncbi:LysR family transcriptional regulator [Yersinia alsatica]|uniref:LysR family transcriptional regulator n=1 Tax=Yersinia alsatica TaxID=2890317 RepID=A0ABY5UPL7_9GAMM|nr:LysR family transcriptional regulator [Yersinia alsatica]OWF69370.1 LysR family transcriptional regulator [Yersinia frederiksenii]UWM45416.1 LysR family transcriptional regulator [Yersinia alsatica]CNL49295.1 LysR family transcriptional regulator [Yersinia frederiksenii]CNL63985.1 LysR family transcriptional regulator [Yersinia frederiksenii]
MTETNLSGIDRIELMQTFIRIVEAGSLSGAAARLGTSQPTISRRLQTLERLLGLKLLQRTTHIMKLTDDGERCYSHAKELVASWNAMEDDLRAATDEPRGLLRVLVPHAFGQDQLIKPLKDYLYRYPKMSVEWTLNDRRPDFIAEGIDCAIQVGAVTDPSVVAILLAEVPRIVVAAPELLNNKPLPTHPEQLLDFHWIALNSFYRNEVVLSHKTNGEIQRFSIEPQLSTDSLYALRNAALAGLGAGIASTWVISDDLAQGRLVHLAPDWHGLPLPIYLVYPHASFYPARLRAFLDIMRQAMPSLAGTQLPSKKSRSTPR